jgi:thiol-disulfide isomerase/thioredoxin
LILLITRAKPNDNISMRIWHYFIIAGVAYGLVTEVPEWLQKRKQDKIVAQSMKAGGTQLAKAGIPASCTGKKYCVTAFIAPWCGACRMTEPAFQSIHKHLQENPGEVGFGLVIGAASPEENAKRQQDLAPIESYTDDSGEIMQSRGIRAFPTWVTVDNTGKEVFRQAGGMKIPDESQVAQAIESMLGR